MALAPQVPLQQIVPTWSGPDCLLDLSVIAKVCPNIKGNLGSVPFTLGAIVNGFVTITPTVSREERSLGLRQQRKASTFTAQC